MPSNCARPDQRRAKRDSQSPNGQQIGRKWAIKGRHAVCPSGRGQIVPRWRRSADNAASSPRKRRRFRPRSPFGTCKICHPGGTRPPESSIRAGTCWESAAAPPRAHVSPRRAARAASSPASPLAHGRLLTISDHDTTIPAQKQAIPAPSQRPPFRPACQPVKRRPRLNPAGIRNRRDLGEIRQSVLRLVLPCLPRRARNLRQRRRLPLAQVRKLAPVLEPALDCVPPVANVRKTEKLSIPSQCSTPPSKNYRAICRRHRATGVFGLFAIFPGAIGHCIQPSNLPLSFKLLQKPAQQRPDLRRSGAKRCKFGVLSCIFQGRSLARTHARARGLPVFTLLDEDGTLTRTHARARGLPV